MFIFLVAANVWLGASTTRALIANELLRTDTETLSIGINDELAPEAQREAYRLLSMTSVVVLASYAVALAASVVFLFTSPFRMKEHGWLLMSAILFYVFVPVEVFTLYLDGKMISLEFFTTEGLEQFHELFLARVGALAGAPTVAALCYFTIIGLAVFQPFRKRRPA
ncbi:MAG: hypothetical protein C4326_09555 [Ignavibacteria bacterium]